MPWIYHPSTARLYHDQKLVGKGWAGRGSGKLNAAAQAQRNVGPLPRGSYTIGRPFDYSRTPARPHGTGPYSMRLTPSTGNHMFGRDGFLIHGPSRVPRCTPTHPTCYGQESDGCIIMPLWIRHQIGSSADRTLGVVQ